MRPILLLAPLSLALACSEPTRISTPGPRQPATGGAQDRWSDDEGNPPWNTDSRNEARQDEQDDDPVWSKIGIEAPPRDGQPNEGNEDDKVRASGGQGGKTGLVEETFTASNGQRSTYKINVPEDAGPDKPYGLHVHLHGDGGGGYRDFPNRQPAHGLIGVTVKAPNFNLQWGRREGVPHALYLHELIQNEIVKKYNIDLDRIYFSGVSGGAYFLTGSFLPAYGHHYLSGAFILCGGETPRTNVAQPEMLKKLRIYWQMTAGERYDIARDVQASIEAYGRLLDQVLQGDSSFDKKSVQDFEIAGRGGHCEFDDLPYTPGIQSIIDRKFQVVLK